MQRVSGLPPRELEQRYLEILLRHWLLQESASLYAPLDANSKQYPQPPRRHGLRRGERGYRISPSARLTPRPDAGTQVKIRHFDDVQQAFVHLQRVVVLGEPGAGKSTSLQRLTYELAQAAIEDAKAPLPFYVRLGDWTDPDKTPLSFIKEQVTSVAEYATEDPDEQNELQQPLQDLATSLEALCKANRAILLLDGLNELPTWSREPMVKAMRGWLGKLPTDLPLYVACREDDYQEPIKLALDELSIEPLTIPRIRDAIQLTFAWLAEVDGIEAPERKAEGLFLALTKDGDSGVLLTLARNPYLLSLLILQWEDDKERLPSNQSQLFEFFTDSLLENEGLVEVVDEKGIIETLTSVGDHLLECLSALAWELQTQRINEDRERGGDAGVLTTLPSEAAVARFGPSGLKRAAETHLLDVGPQVRFTHQLLQEYFTARGMQSRIEDGRLHASELWREPWERSGWEVATGLLAGR